MYGSNVPFAVTRMDHGTAIHAVGIVANPAFGTTGIVI